MNLQHYTITGANPMGAPRQTRADKWLRRPCVLRYREFRDAIKAGTKGIMTKPHGMVVIAYLPIPKSIKGAKRAAMLGQPHRVKPDADNIYKAVSDAIIPDDQRIHAQACFKYWAEEPRIEIYVSDRPRRPLDAAGILGAASGSPAPAV